jgi:hypothetical protein
MFSEIQEAIKFLKEAKDGADFAYEDTCSWVDVEEDVEFIDDHGNIEIHNIPFSGYRNDGDPRMTALAKRLCETIASLEALAQEYSFLEEWEVEPEDYSDANSY